MKPSTPEGLKVSNLLDINNARRSFSNKLTWEENSELDISKYFIYRSFVPYGEFLKIKEVSKDTLEHTDDTTLTTSPFMPGDVNGLFQTIDGLWYYKISAVNELGEESDLTNPVSYEETEAFDNDDLFTDGYSLDSQTFSYGQDDYCDLPDNEDMKYYFEAIRGRNVWNLLQNGQNVWLYKRRKEGEKCPHWDDQVNECLHPLGKEDDGSDACYGTGFLGGYYDPVIARIRFISTDSRVVVEREGMRVNENPRGWTIWTPRLSNFDFLVTAEGHRYEITNVVQPRFRGGLITHQSFDLIRKWETDWIWKVPVPGALR